SPSPQPAAWHRGTGLSRHSVPHWAPCPEAPFSRPPGRVPGTRTTPGRHQLQAADMLSTWQVPPPGRATEKVSACFSLYNNNSSLQEVVYTVFAQKLSQKRKFVTSTKRIICHEANFFPGFSLLHPGHTFGPCREKAAHEVPPGACSLRAVHQEPGV